MIATPLLLAASRLAHGPFPPLAGRDVWACVVLSLTGLVGNTTVWYWGLGYTSPLNAGILGGAAPVVVALAAALWLRDRLTRRQLAGIVLTVAAVCLTPSVDQDKCSGCRICNNLCPFNAILFHEDRMVTEINPALCQGCGTCVAACPAGAFREQSSPTSRSSPRSKACSASTLSMSACRALPEHTGDRI